MSLVTVARVFDRSDALILRSVLESEGLIAFVAEYDLLTVLPHLTFAVGGYRLQVPAEDEAGAREILRLARTEAARVPQMLELRVDWYLLLLSLAITVIFAAPLPLYGSRLRTDAEALPAE
jgi:hypothetical protein